jgi:hypothetical protein
VYRRAGAVKRSQGGAGWVGVTDDVTSRRLHFEFESTFKQSEQHQ